ncbi:hypothetical protein, partial [Paramuribaculum intestinale]|uniref:hypothetical protein n=1 Tax=Paramuribaculum intestinale TaxID=2094151 RepID=UPI00267446C1
FTPMYKRVCSFLDCKRWDLKYVFVSAKIVVCPELCNSYIYIFERDLTGMEFQRENLLGALKIIVISRRKNPKQQYTHISQLVTLSV